MLDDTTKMRMDKLREYREQLSEVDTVHSPDIAAQRQAELRQEIENLEGLLHSELFRLDRIIELWDHRSSFSHRMDREDILRALGLFEEPEPRDTPKLDNLMNNPGFTFGPGGVIEAVAKAREDFGPSLEDMLFLGGDRALKTWVDGLSPMQMGALLVMGPRLVELVREKYATLESMQGPGDQIQRRQFLESPMTFIQTDGE